MTRLIIDPQTLAKLHKHEGLVEICDESGKIVGYFQPVVRANGVGQMARSPFSDEELKQRQQQRTGRPLAEILERLSHS